MNSEDLGWTQQDSSRGESLAVARLAELNLLVWQLRGVVDTEKFVTFAQEKYVYTGNMSISVTTQVGMYKKHSVSIPLLLWRRIILESLEH